MQVIQRRFSEDELDSCTNMYKKIEKKGIEFEGKKGPIQQNVFFLLNYRPLLETERFLYLPELLLTTYGLKAQ